MTIEEEFKEWILLYYPHSKYVNSLSNKWVIKFAEYYHQKRVKSISDNTQKAIDEFTRLQTKYPRMATVDVVKMLKRLIQDLKLLKQ